MSVLIPSIVALAELSALDAVIEGFRHAAALAQLPPAQWGQLELVGEEIFVNIALYAFPPAAAGRVRFNFEAVRPGVLQVEVVDDGRPFDPLSVPAPNLAPTLSKRTGSGLGVFLVRELTETLSYEFANGQNRLRFLFPVQS